MNNQLYTDKQLRNAIQHHEIGGGHLYPKKITSDQADRIVKTKHEFRKAISKSNTIVYIDDEVSWDLTGDEAYQVAEGVTIASGRGINGSHGAFLKTSSQGPKQEKGAFRGILRVAKPRVRITGIRMRGPHLNLLNKKPRDDYCARGIHIIRGDCEVDNCELYGWTEAAITVGTRNSTPRADIHHNHIHDCMLVGYGYGVDVVNGYANIRYNYFNRTRHAIDGFGYETCSYTCEDNLFGPETYSHAVDMHCLEENRVGKSTDPNSPVYKLRAGGHIEIRRNTFCFTKNVEGECAQAVVIRGYPKHKAIIEANHFMHRLTRSEPCENVCNRGYQDVPYRQPNVKKGWHKIEFRDNYYGHTTSFPKNVGAPIDLPTPAST